MCFAVQLLFVHLGAGLPAAEARLGILAQCMHTLALLIIKNNNNKDFLLLSNRDELISLATNSQREKYTVNPWQRLQGVERPGKIYPAEQRPQPARSSMS
jgi:hypothetical protein